MKTAPLVLIALLLASTGAHATSMSLSGDYVRWVEHHDVDDARLAITTENGKVTLLITQRVVALQLSDHMIRKVKHKLRDKVENQDDALGRAIVSAVAGSVREMIDSSFEIRIQDLRDVTYEDGRLRFIGRNGKAIFEESEFDDDDVMSSFSETDARAFVREFHRLKTGS